MRTLDVIAPPTNHPADSVVRQIHHFTTHASGPPTMGREPNPNVLRQGTGILDS